MPKADKVEVDRRLRTVQEWIIEDIPYQDMVNQMVQKWGIEERQAKRYVREARRLWVDQEQAIIDHKRRLKVESLKKLKRSLQSQFVGTPAGMNAILRIEKEIITLEGLRPATKLELTGKNGTDLFTGKSDEELMNMLEDILSKVDGK